MAINSVIRKVGATRSIEIFFPPSLKQKGRGGTTKIAPPLYRSNQDMCLGIGFRKLRLEPLSRQEFSRSMTTIIRTS